jgi:hypothetical protein
MSEDREKIMSLFGGANNSQSNHRTLRRNSKKSTLGATLDGNVNPGAATRATAKTTGVGGGSGAATPSYQDLLTVALGQEDSNGRRKSSTSRGGSVDRAHVNRIRGASFSNSSNNNNNSGRSRANSNVGVSSKSGNEQRRRAGSMGEKKQEENSKNTATLPSATTRQKFIAPDYKSLRASFDNMTLDQCNSLLGTENNNNNNNNSSTTPNQPTRVATRTSSLPRGTSTGISTGSVRNTSVYQSTNLSDSKPLSASSARQIITKTQRRRSENLASTAAPSSSSFPPKSQTHHHHHHQEQFLRPSGGGVLKVEDIDKVVEVKGPLYHHALDDIYYDDDDDSSHGSNMDENGSIIQREGKKRRGKRLVNGVNDEVQSKHVTESLRAALTGILDPHNDLQQIAMKY